MNKYKYLIPTLSGIIFSRNSSLLNGTEEASRAEKKYTY